MHIHRAPWIATLALVTYADVTGCVDETAAEHELGALAIVAADAGAADAPRGAIDGGLNVPARASDAGPDGASVRPDPNGLYVAEVVANGSGCPNGTWSARISADGKTFTTTFTSFEVSIESDSVDPAAVKNCTLAVHLHSPKEVSYTLQSFAFAGYAFLAEGVAARISARSWFQGNAVPTNNHSRMDVVGPYDKNFVYYGDVRSEEQVWSTCGTERDLNINTTIQLVNSQPKRSGYVNIDKMPLDGVITLGVRACGTTLPPTIWPGKG